MDYYATMSILMYEYADLFIEFIQSDQAEPGPFKDYFESLFTTKKLYAYYQERGLICCESHTEEHFYEFMGKFKSTLIRSIADRSGIDYK